MKLIVTNLTNSGVTVATITVKGYSSAEKEITNKEFDQYKDDLRELKEKGVIDYDLVDVETPFGAEGFDPTNKAQRMQFDPENGTLLYNDGSEWTPIGNMLFYTGPGDPKVDTNPPSTGMMWVNTDTNEIWFCTDNTEDVNTWISTTGKKIEGDRTISDFFGDGSVIAHWRLNGDRQDSVGTFHGFGTPEPEYIEGAFGQGIDFYPTFGTRGYCLFPDVFSPGNLPSFTVAFRLYANKFVIGAPSTFSFFQMGGYVDGSGNVWGVSIALNGKFHAVFGDGTNIEDATLASYLIGSWDLITLTYDATTREYKFYVADSLVYTGTLSFDPMLYNGGENAIGSTQNYTIYNSTAAGNLTNAAIDQVRIFNRVLSDAEVVQLANETNS